MPIISSFYGITIRMYFLGNEHNPPHFHAYYGEAEASYDIRTMELIDGALPSRAGRMVREWASAYRNELMHIWESQEFEKLPPLE